MGIPPEALGTSVHPERHVPALGVPRVDGSNTSGAKGPSRSWSGRYCTYMSVSDQTRTVEVPSVCVTKPWTTPWATGVAKEEILFPSVNFGPVFVQLVNSSKGFMKLRSIRISRWSWAGNSTVAIRSPWMVRWALRMPSSPTVRHGWLRHAIGRVKKMSPIWNCLRTVAWSWLLVFSLQYGRACAACR